MFLEDQLTIGAIIFSVIGIIGIAVVYETQTPIETTLGLLPNLPLQSKVSFIARIEKQRAFQNSVRLELYDGNAATGTLPKGLQKDLKANQQLFRFEGRLTQKEPVKVQIMRVKPLD